MGANRASMWNAQPAPTYIFYQHTSALKRAKCPKNALKHAKCPKTAYFPCFLSDISNITFLPNKSGLGGSQHAYLPVLANILSISYQYPINILSIPYHY